jgi:hypothetical protein
MSWKSIPSSGIYIARAIAGGLRWAAHHCSFSEYKPIERPLAMTVKRRNETPLAAVLETNPSKSDAVDTRMCVRTHAVSAATIDSRTVGGVSRMSTSRTIRQRAAKSGKGRLTPFDPPVNRGLLVRIQPEKPLVPDKFRNFPPSPDPPVPDLRQNLSRQIFRSSVTLTGADSPRPASSRGLIANSRRTMHRGRVAATCPRPAGPRIRTRIPANESGATP